MADRRHRLELRIRRAPTTVLPGPTIEGMKRDVHETLSATVDVRLTDRRTGAVSFEGRGECGGLEVMGPVHRLRP
jgi:hypothetical protein